MTSGTPDLSPMRVGSVGEAWAYAVDEAVADFGLSRRGRSLPIAPDVRAHVERLGLLLDLGHEAPAADYIRWLASICEARALPASRFEALLDAIAAALAAPAAGVSDRHAAAALDRARARAREAGPSTAAEALTPDAWPASAVFEAALTAGDHAAAWAVLERLLGAGADLVEVEMHVIQPALYGVGGRWQRNQISVEAEHLATAIAQSVMVDALLRSRPRARTDRKVLVASVAGNHHAVGVQMIADAFLLAGWAVDYLGADAQVGAIVERTQSVAPHLIGLSLSLPEHLTAAKATIAALEAAFGDSRPPVIVGGLAINGFSMLAEMIGADDWAPDAAAAVRCGCRLTGAGPPL